MEGSTKVETASFVSDKKTYNYRRITSDVAFRSEQISPQLGDIFTAPDGVLYGGEDMIISEDGTSTETVIRWKQVSIPPPPNIRFPGTTHVLVAGDGSDKLLWMSMTGIRTRKCRKKKKEEVSPITSGSTLTVPEASGPLAESTPPLSRPSTSRAPSVSAASSMGSVSTAPTSETSSRVPLWSLSVNESLAVRPTAHNHGVPFPRVQENAWILWFFDRWNEPSISKLPTAQEGRTIIEFLLAFPSPIPKWNEYLNYHDVVPGMHDLTIANVIADILNTEKDVPIVICDCETKEPIDSLSTYQVLAHFLMSSNVASWKSDNRLLSFLDVLFTEEGSLQTQTKLPDSLTDDGCIAALTGLQEKLAFSSSLCPPGGITHVHVDYHGAAQLMISIEANKLWLIWPLSDHNLNVWSGYHRRRTGVDSTVKLVQEMEGLKLMHMKGKQAFILPPYHFHAVLTFDVSAHAGVKIWTYKHFNFSRQGAEWELRWAMNYFNNGFHKDEAVDILEQLKAENVNMFRELTRCFPDHGRCEEVKTWAKTFVKEIQEGLGTLNGTRKANKRKRVP